MSLKKLTLPLILILIFNTLASSLVLAASDKILVTQIKLEADELTMFQDEIYNVSYKVYPSNATNTGVTFESYDTDIVYANPGGRLRSKEKSGTATIKVSSDDGNAVTYLTVRVLGYDEDDMEYLSRISITMDGEFITSHTAMVNDTFRLSYRYWPTNASDTTVKWSSSDKTVATVTQSGVVTAVSQGECTITAKAQDGSKVSDSITLEVTPYVRYPTSISFTANKTEYTTGTVITFTPTFYPADTTVKTVHYTVSGPATINDYGVATLYDAGTVTFTFFNYAYQTVYTKSITVKYSDDFFGDFAESAKGVKSDRAILISFTSPVNASAAADYVFAAKDMYGNGDRIPVTVEQYAENILAVKPSDKWTKGTNYIFLKSGLTNTGGNPLGCNLRYTFEARE